jgi:hypothetical protein
MRAILDPETLMPEIHCLKEDFGIDGLTITAICVGNREIFQEKQGGD